MRLAYAPRWKNIEIFTMEEWIAKRIEFVKVAKSTCFMSGIT